MSSPLLLVSHDSKEQLYLYLIAFEETFVAILVKETLKGQFPIYYVSKTLHNSEFSYSRIEKLAYSLLMASHKLRQYFQSHHIIVLTDKPLKEILQKMTNSSRMVKLSIELNEYSLKFRPR